MIEKRRSADLIDYWEILTRLRWWLVLPTVLITGATLGGSLKVPKMYRSETLILVEPQKVPTDYAKSTASTDETDRLQNIRQEDRFTKLLNRGRLQNFLHATTETHDLMVLDTAPVLSVADTQTLAAIVNSAILVIGARRSPYKLVCQVGDLLKPKAIGVVLNGTEQIPCERFYYGYYKKSEKGQ